MRYKKRPDIIEAIQYNGSNKDEVDKFVGYKLSMEKDKLLIFSVDGILEASVGDYIVKGISNSIYPCDKQVFEAKYEKY